MDYMTEGPLICVGGIAGQGSERRGGELPEFSANWGRFRRI